MGGGGDELYNTRHQGYTPDYYWTGWQAGHWSCGTRWKGLNTGNLFRALLRTSKLLITNWAVSFTFSGLFTTSRSFSTSDKSLKLGGITILFSQFVLSFWYLEQWNKKWISFSMLAPGFSHTWHSLSTSGSLGRAHLPVSSLSSKHPSLNLAKIFFG